METTKCAATRPGLSSVSTVIPPSTACSSTPSGSSSAIATRERRRGDSHTAAHTHSTTTANTAIVKMRLLNSINMLRVGIPALGAGTRLLAVQRGHVGQPSPD
jgi:hypothetical protein